METANATLNDAVVAAVRDGLERSPKKLPSWLLYDDEGDRLFQQIMHMPEYYPTRCEYDLLTRHKDDILRLFDAERTGFQLIELGAGDGLKIEILLNHFVRRGANLVYNPVDISANALAMLQERLHASIPDLRINPQNKSYDEALSDLASSNQKKVILFMGANIGNFNIRQAVEFLKRVSSVMNTNDLLLVGFDLKKDPRIIQEAYDDPRGLTAKFNLNLLHRLNKELNANFDIDQFSHYPYYDPETGAMKSFLISMKDQYVFIPAIGKSIHFGLWEAVQTEISQKYDLYMIEKIMTLAGLRIHHVFSDCDGYFADVVAGVV